MKKFLSLFAAILFAGSMMAADPVEIASGTFDGKNGNYTEGWSTTGTGKSRTDCIIIGAGENITSPEVDLSNYESITVQIKARRYGTLSGSKAQIAVTFDGEAIGSTEAKGTTATTALDAIEYTVNDLSTGNFVITCSNATSAGSTHGAGINSIVITGIEKSGEGGEQEGTVKTVYCKVTQGWWTADDAATGIYAYAAGNVENAAWPGVRMEAVEGEAGLWKADIDTAMYDAIIFTRFNPSDEGNQDWGAKTGDLQIPADKDLYTITSEEGVWGDLGVAGEWSKYVAPVPVEDVTIYCVNTAEWETVNAYVWTNEEVSYKGWPGEAMTKTENQIHGFDVYSYTFPENYVNIIFNNGDEQTANLTWDAAKPYFYDGKWYESATKIPAPAVPLEGNIWKAVASTPVLAGSHYIDEELIKMDGYYGTTLKENARTIAGEEFTHAIQVRTNNYPTTSDVIGTEKSGSTPLIITAKENIEVTFYYNRQALDASGTENDNKDLIIVDQAAPTVKLEGEFVIDQVLEGNNYLNATKKVMLEKDHVYTATAAGTTLQLHGVKFEVPVPAKYYITGDSALVVDAGLEAEKQWNPEAFKAEGDTLVLSLKAEQEYKLKVTDGTWNVETVKGFTALTEKAEGLSADADNNIVFSLAEAGEVKVVYIAGEEPVFKLIGNFFVPDPTVSVFGTMTNPAWEVEVPFDLAEDKKSASLTAHIAAGDYGFKVVVNGEWRSNGYEFHRGFPAFAGIAGNSEADMVFKADVDGNYTISWFFENDSLDIIYPEAPVVIPAKFYVTGDSALVVDAGLEAAKAWAPNAFKAENDTIALSLKANQEYKLKITLDGEWETGRGYSSLSEVPAGVRNDNDDNIIFSLAEEGEVKVIYFVEDEQVTYKIEGSFYVKPVILKDLYLVPGVWAEGDAKIAAWIWGENYDGRFTEFMAPKAEGNDTLVVKIDSDADHVTFVRFNNTVEAPTWENESANVWNKVENMEIADCGIFFVNYWNNYSWCEPVEVQLPVILFEGDHHVSWTSPLDLEAAKFENAKAGDKIVVTYNNASHGIEFKALEVWSHIAGSRMNAWISGNGTYEQFLTAKAVEEIKEHGLQIIGENFNCTKVELVAGRELKEGTTVWAGYFWADAWSTITLYPEGYNYVDFSKVQALRIYSEANRTDYVVKIVKQWEPFEAYANVEDFAINEEYAELTMTDELRTALKDAGQWDIQFNKESGAPFNVTEIVLVMDPGTGTGIENNAAEVKAVKVLKNGMIQIIKGEHIYNLMGQKVQ